MWVGLLFSLDHVPFFCASNNRQEVPPISYDFPCIGVCPQVCLVASEIEESIVSPGTGVVDGCELPRGGRESNPAPLQEQQVFLTTESTLQPL